MATGLQDRIHTKAGERVRMGDPLYFDIVEFLEDEATMLDNSELMTWVTIMAEDLVYRMPVRQTRGRDDASEFAKHMYHVNESLGTLFIKTMRLAQTPSAWAENPSSRTRRFITNIRVYRTERDDEVFVTSSILLIRNRYDHPTYDLVSAERQDVIRQAPTVTPPPEAGGAAAEAGGGFKLAERYIYVDQATIGTPNLAVFL